jgi:hypothetical protein
VDLNGGTVRRGGHPVVGFGDATQAVAQAGLWGAASVALTALRADPGYCQTVAQAGTPTSEAVLNFKRAWNAQSGVSPLPSGPSYEAATASAIQQVLGGTAFVPGCAAPSRSPSPARWAFGLGFAATLGVALYVGYRAAASAGPYAYPAMGAR